RDQECSRIARQETCFRNLFRPSDHGSRSGRQDVQAEVRASWWKSPCPEHREQASGNHGAESWFRCGSGESQPERHQYYARESERQHGRRPGAPVCAGVQCSIPPRSVARSARFVLPLPEILRADEECLSERTSRRSSLSDPARLLSARHASSTIPARKRAKPCVKRVTRSFS